MLCRLKTILSSMKNYRSDKYVYSLIHKDKEYINGEYKFLIWRDQSGICFKCGIEYGDCCWETIWPKQKFKKPLCFPKRSYFIIPIFKKKNNK